MAAEKKIVLAQNNKKKEKEKKKKDAIHKVAIFWGMNSAEESLAVPDRLFKPLSRRTY